MDINGIILLNKEKGISSNSAVNKVKKILGAKKAGHFGTLDVLGEGLLPIALGKGTKLFEYFLNKDKVYKTIFKFGCTTDTLDLESEITMSNDITVSLNDLNAVLNKFEGEMYQYPPQYSAKKVSGVPAYKLARRGEKLELKPKLIKIYSIKVLKQLDKNIFELEVWCSSGTYIRSLCRDIAEKLGTYGIMLYIQRTRCGNFRLEDSFTLDEIQNGNYKVITLDNVFDFPVLELNSDDSIKLLNGVKIDKSSLKENQQYKCFGPDGFLGIGYFENKKLFLSLRLI